MPRSPHLPRFLGRRLARPLWPWYVGPFSLPQGEGTLEIQPKTDPTYSNVFRRLFIGFSGVAFLRVGIGAGGFAYRPAWPSPIQVCTPPKRLLVLQES